MPTDNGLAVCAAVIQLSATYKLLREKHFGKQLTLRSFLRKGKARSRKVPRNQGENRHAGKAAKSICRVRYQKALKVTAEGVQVKQTADGTIESGAKPEMQYELGIR